MARKPPKKFKSKDEITAFIDGICADKGLDDRDHLARAVGITSSALYGYIYRKEIPDKTYQKFLNVDVSQKQSVSGSVASTSELELSKISLDDLLAEIEKRGWKVDLSRLPQK